MSPFKYRHLLLAMTLVSATLSGLVVWSYLLWVDPARASTGPARIWLLIPIAAALAVLVLKGILIRDQRAPQTISGSADLPRSTAARTRIPHATELSSGPEYVQPVEAAHAVDTDTAWPLRPPRPSTTDIAGRRILVADDDPVNRRLLQAYVIRSHGVFIGAVDGQEAIEKSRTGVDVVITDIHMPRADGVAVMRAIRQCPNAQPVIALTAEAGHGLAGRYRRLGFEACLAKPVSEKALLETVLRALERSHWVSGEADVSSIPLAKLPRYAELPIVDTQKAIEIAGGNRALAHELYDMLLADLRSKRRPLQSRSGHDPRQLRELAHEICGGARFCGARRVEACATHLESALKKERPYPSISRLSSELLAAVDELLAAPNPYLDTPDEKSSG